MAGRSLRFLRRRFGWWAPLVLVAFLWLGSGFYSWAPWEEGLWRSADAMLLTPLHVDLHLLAFRRADLDRRSAGQPALPAAGVGTAPRYSLIGLLVGLGAYAISWRMALLRVVEAYEKLPPDPPKCFVATAAARAPLGLTRGFAAMAGGASFQATPQLQHFKLFEIVLREVSPERPPRPAPASTTGWARSSRPASTRRPRRLGLAGARRSKAWPSCCSARRAERGCSAQAALLYRR